MFLKQNRKSANVLLLLFINQYFWILVEGHHCVKIGQSGLVNSKLNIKITKELNNIYEIPLVEII